MRIRLLILPMLTGAMWPALVNVTAPTEMAISTVREPVSTEQLGSQNEPGESEKKWSAFWS